LDEAHKLLEKSNLKFEWSELDSINESFLIEAEYQGKKVKLGKIMQGDVKKFKVYVKNDKGSVVKVNFGQKGVKIKKNNPKRVVEGFNANAKDDRKVSKAWCSKKKNR
jgi:hypothetical protein